MVASQKERNINFSLAESTLAAAERQVVQSGITKSTLQSCGSLDIPIDNSIVDKGVNEILASFNPKEQLAAFDLTLQRASNYSASKAGYDLTLGSISLPVEIDFKENLIKSCNLLQFFSEV